MNEVNTTALLERVKRLERQNKLIKLTGIVVALVIALVLLVGAKEKVSKEIVAEKFRVVDPYWRTRAILDVNQDGPGLALYDENGKLRALLAVHQDGPGLALYDENEKPRATLTALQKGTFLALFDENGKVEFSAP